MRNFLKKPVFLKGNGDWISELPSANKQYSDTIHHSKKMTLSQASKKEIEKKVYSNLQDRRVRQDPKYKLRQFIRTGDIERNFSKGDSTNCSYELYTVTEVSHDTIFSYELNYLPERYNEILLRSKFLTLDENNQDMKELNSIQ